MSTTIIYQRDKNAVLVNGGTTVLTTATPVRGLAYDGHYLWASEATLYQIDPRLLTIVGSKAISPAETYDSLAFDGEYLWGPVSGNKGHGQVERSTATRVNFIGSLFTAGPIGNAWDGEFHWHVYLNGITGTYFIAATDHLYSAILYQFNTGSAGPFRGLVFDGEHLVAAATVAGNVQLLYYDRNGNLVYTTTGGSGAGGDANGLAFDGEYFYTMLSV